MHIASTIVIGCGGTGGHLTPPLARLLSYHPNAGASGEHPITIIDGDDFEEHNATRQHAGPGQIGINKAAHTARLCTRQGLAVTPVDQYLDKAMLRRLLAKEPGVALVVAAVDNDATRKLCIDVLLERGDNFFFLTPGNSSANDPNTAIKGNVLWFGADGGQQYGINPALVFPNIEHPQDAAPRYGTCSTQAPSAPQLITANAIAAAYSLAVVQNLLDGQLPDTSSSCFFNGRTFTNTFS